MRRYYTLLLSMLISFSVLAQQKRIKFSTISLQEGLSQSSVSSIVQDKTGFMWFATLDGLNQYDGYSIKIYGGNTGDPGELTDNVINALFVADDESGGDLWIGTAAGGLCRYDEVHDRFDVFRNSK